MDTIPLYEAIAQMRKLSSAGKPFSITHSTYDRERQSSSGIRHVQNCILRPSAKGDDVKDAEHKLFYKDLDLPKSNQNRNCWQILIMFFNGMKCELN